jgi:gliding motility-associated-like protein
MLGEILEILGKVKIGGFEANTNFLYPNSFVVRRGGNGFSGYEFHIGVGTMNDHGAPLIIPDNEKFPISSGSIGTQRVTDPQIPGYRKLFFELEPNPNGQGYLLNLDLLVTTSTNNPRMVSVFKNVPYFFQAPKNLKIGFAGSTGLYTNFHEIRNLFVDVSNKEALKNPEALDLLVEAECLGVPNIFQINEADIILPNENSFMNCLNIYPDLNSLANDIDAQFFGSCGTEGSCTLGMSIINLPQGTITKEDGLGRFSFISNPGFEGQEIEFFYTVTDNYGKSSMGNSIKLKIPDSPGLLKLSAEFFDGEENHVIACEGETVSLIANSSFKFNTYEWFNSGELVQSGPSQIFNAVKAGNYQVTAYSNSRACPVSSEFLNVNFVSIPEINVSGPPVICEPGSSFDLTTYINNYQPEIYDYRIETPFGVFLMNAELNELFGSGLYFLEVKLKEGECWSNPELVLVEEAQELTKAIFEIESENVISDENNGAVYILNEPINFKDLSLGEVVSWNWDFGDGNSSTSSSPKHVYKREGDYTVTLTVTNNLGCINNYSLDVPVRKNLQVMFPTAFTPQLSDNQYFRPKTRGISKMKLLVFNLWGNLLFETNDINSLGWDGFLAGEPQPSGNYVFKAVLESEAGDYLEKSGTFMLVR